MFAKGTKNHSKIVPKSSQNPSKIDQKLKKIDPELDLRPACPPKSKKMHRK